MTTDMTLRDSLANEVMKECLRQMLDDFLSDPETIERVATVAYDLADAMLKARGDTDDHQTQPSK